MVTAIIDLNLFIVDLHLPQERSRSPRVNFESNLFLENPTLIKPNPNSAVGSASGPRQQLRCAEEGLSTHKGYDDV